MFGVKNIFLDEHFEPSLGRATRITVAFILPLIWGFLTGQVSAAVWISIGAQALTFTQLEGSYPIKLLIMSGAVLVSSMAGFIGVLAGNSIWCATLLMLLVAFIGGFVRQSGPHGPGITIGVLLIYLLCLDSPGDSLAAVQMFFWVLSGGILALLCTLFSWVFIPYSPFRRPVSYSWNALSDWLRLIAVLSEKGIEKTEEDLNEKESAFRVALDTSRNILTRKQGIAHSLKNKIAYHLVELRRIASFADPAVSTLQDSIEQICKQKDISGKLITYIIENLSQAAKRIAISTISNNSAKLFTIKLRIKRLKNNIVLLKEDIPEFTSFSNGKHFLHSVNEIILLMEESVAIIENMNRKNENHSFFRHNFFTGMIIPQKVPIIRFSFSPRSFPFRYALRLAIAMGIGIAVYKIFHIPHGYWIAMTAMIILQPDFGATLTKALRRVKGTVLGVIIGSFIFLFPLPFPIPLIIAAVCSFLMAYYLQHNYAVAAFFITIMVIALYHLIEPVTWEIGLIRLLNTLGGAGLALLGGYAFFPIWERHRLPVLIQEAILKNKEYLEALLSVPNNGMKTNLNLTKYRRDAEVANANTFYSLQRMKQEPKFKQANKQSFYLITG